MLTLTYRDLVAAAPVLQQLAASKTLAPSLTIRVYRLVRETDPALEDFGHARQKILDGYIERGEDGEPVPVVENGQVDPDRVKLTDPAAARDALNELLEETVQLKAGPLPASLFASNGKLELSAAALIQLGPILQDDGADS